MWVGAHITSRDKRGIGAYNIVHLMANMWHKCSAHIECRDAHAKDWLEGGGIILTTKDDSNGLNFLVLFLCKSTGEYRCAKFKVWAFMREGHIKLISFYSLNFWVKPKI